MKGEEKFLPANRKYTSFSMSGFFIFNLSVFLIRFFSALRIKKTPPLDVYACISYVSLWAEFL